MDDGHHTHPSGSENPRRGPDRPRFSLRRKPVGPLGTACRNLAVAIIVGAVALTLVTLIPSEQGSPVAHRSLDIAGYGLVVIASAALAGRHRAPVAVLLVCAPCMLVYQAVGYPGAAIVLPTLVATYTAVRAGYRALAGVTIVITLTKGAAATAMALDPGDSLGEAIEMRLLLAGWLIASGVMGEMARKRAAYLEQVEQRAIEAEYTREEVARRRAGEERLRIARELHDSLTHSISVIKVQAGVAVHLAHKRGEEAPGALVAIEEASRDATQELRSALDVLRSDERSPRRRLDQLGDLVARSDAAGVPVTLSTRGQEQALPADIDRAAYRIVQEALTNVTRHAGPAEATVTLDYQPDLLCIDIDDDGLATPRHPPAPGVGLQGMRERVTALGGTLTTGPRPGGGFSVSAELPVPTDSAPDDATDADSTDLHGTVSEPVVTSAPLGPAPPVSAYQPNPEPATVPVGHNGRGR